MAATRVRRGWVAALATSILVLTGVTGVAPAAQADTAPVGSLPATVSADPLPTWQVDGIVWSQVTVGTTVYATGSFTTARPPGVAVGGTGQVSVGNLIAYDITTGNLVTSFKPILNGQGRSITASPDGSRVYVGGDFTTVTVNGTTSTRSNLAAFSTATGALVSGFALDLNGAVMSMTATSSTLYLGGAFTRVGTTARRYVAAVDAVSGALRTGWAPSADDGYVKALTLTPDKTKVVVGGQFSTLSGVAAKGMGALDASTGAVLPWAANKVIVDYLSSAIDTLSSDGTSVYGGGFAYTSGGFFEGTFAMNPADGSVRWADDCQGDTYDVEPVGNVVYSVGHSHDCSMLGLWPDTSPRTRYQPATAMTTTSSGIKNKGPSQYGWDYRSLDTSTMLQWFPALGIGNVSGQSQAAWSVTSGAGYVALGGEFPTVEGRPQQGLTRYAVRSATATDKVGPRYDGTAPVRTVAPQTLAAKTGTRSVTVTWGSAWDQDNARLTYRVYRDRGTANEALVTTTTKDTGFWNVPTQTFGDTNVPDGVHTYQVVISDPFGNTLLSPVSNAVGVQANVPPTASFLTTSSALDASVNGTASSDDGSVAAWSWDFGDGTARGSGSTATHRYATTGTYKVTLTVTDNQGATASTSSTVTIRSTTAAYYKVDEFGRYVTNGWGTADVGGAWSVGTSTAFGVTDGMGKIAVANGSSPTAKLSASSTDTDLSFAFVADRTAAGGGSAFLSGYARGDGSSGYSAKLYAPGTSAMTLSLVGREAGKAEVTLRSVTLPNGLVAGQRYNLRVQATGSGTTALRARVWTDGTPEPTTWQVETTDTTSSLQAAAGVAVQGYTSTKTTNAPLVFGIDHLVARSAAS